MSAVPPRAGKVTASATPHLRPAIGALLCAAALLIAVEASVSPGLPGRLPFYAAHAMSFKVNANVLQRVAFRAPHELPIYGSSELDMWVPHRADAFFQHRPSGFAAFPVGRGGATCLMILQKLAATGDAARNKRTVIFLSPSWFLQPSVDDKAVGANLSLAQLSAWVFGSGLSRTLKTDITRRLRDFSADLKEQTLIASAGQCLATPSPLNRLRFALCYPLGKLQNALLERLDYCVLLWENVFPQRRWAEPPGYDEDPPLAPGGGIDWPRVLAEADAARRAAGTAPDHAQPAPHPAPGERDAEFVAHLQTSREFDDLALLARALRKLRVDALFISQPFDGSYSDSTGVGAAARRGYYERLAAVLREHGYKFCDSSEHEEDRGFFGEVDHPSARAWLFYDQQIDAFYHRTAGASPTAGSPPGGLVGSK